MDSSLHHATKAVSNAVLSAGWKPKADVTTSRKHTLRSREIPRQSGLDLELELALKLELALELELGPCTEYPALKVTAPVTASESHQCATNTAVDMRFRPTDEVRAVRRTRMSAPRAPANGEMLPEEA